MAIALVAVRDGPPLAAAAPVCPKEAACGFKKPLVLFVVDYSTAMNEKYDPYRTRWKAAMEAIAGVVGANDGLLRSRFMLGLLRYGHDPDPKLPGTVIPGDASGLIDGTALDVAPYDLLGPDHAYHECTNADAIVAALGALPPPLGGKPEGIDRWTKGGLERARAVLEQAAKDHPDELGERPAAIILLTAGAWTGAAGGAPLVPPTENPAIAAQALYVAGVPTYVVTLGDAIDAPFAAALAGAGGTGQPLAIACPSLPFHALDPLAVALEQEIDDGTCGQQVPRAMFLIDASSSMLNINGGAQHAPLGQGGWDLLRDSLIGSGSIFAHAVMNDPGRRVEDLAYIGLAVFGSHMPSEEKIVVDYGPCLADNVAWALDPLNSCAQPGCVDPWGGPPISWTFQDGSLVAPPGFTRKTLSHVPRCDQKAPVLQACSGSATYTHRGLLLVAQNLANYREACLQPDAPEPCKESTPFFNVLITDGLYNSTDAQVQAPLLQMYADGVVTHVIGFGEAIGSPQVSASLAKLADWGSGGLRGPHAAVNQDQLEGALAAIFDEALADVAIDPCCTGICDPPPNPVPDEPDPPPETSWGEYCSWTEGGETDGSSTGSASTTSSTGSDTGNDTTGDDTGEPTGGAPTTSTSSGAATTTSTSSGTATTGPGPGTDGVSEGGTDDGPGTGEANGDGGCNCASVGDRTGWLLLFGLLLRRRRRSAGSPADRSRKPCDAMRKNSIHLSYREAPDASALAHIPGNDGLPVLGRAIDAARDFHGMVEGQVRKFGSVSRFNLMGQPGLLVTGADLFQRIFQNAESEFSAEKGYERQFGGFYPGGLVMMDFDVHRAQRRLMQGAFVASARERYLAMMLPLIAARVQAWGGEPKFHFFTNIKHLLLEVAARCFLGIQHMGPEADIVNHKFLELNDGLAALLRLELPFGAYGRGQRARRWLVRWFETMIAARRNGDCGARDDVLSHMCRETDEAGQPYTARQIADHIIFLLFAAHDTAASALTHLAMYLGRDAALQQRLREHLALFAAAPLSHADLGRMDFAECCFHEVLRLHPPGPLTLRRTIRATELGGHAVPPHTVLYLPMTANQRDPQWWKDPTRFDPDRFAPPRSEQRGHPMCFHPFGSGAHKCIGLHFADMLVKAFLHRFVQAFTFTTPPGYAPRLEWLPLPKPADGLPLTLTPTRERSAAR